MNKNAHFCILFLLLSILGTIVIIANFFLGFHQIGSGEDVVTMSNIVAKTVIGLGALAALNCVYAIYVWNFGGISFSEDEVAARKLTKILSIANSLNVFPIGLVLAIVLHKKIHLIR